MVQFTMVPRNKNKKNKSEGGMRKQEKKRSYSAVVSVLNIVSKKSHTSNKSSTDHSHTAHP